MQKRAQNKVAESRIALPVVAFYGVAVWLAAGLLTGMWWVQFACTAVATYLMAELNNQNALIRIYSRMVSCAFLVLTCAGCSLFPSLHATVGTLCFVAFLLLLFRTYQDHESPGGTFYAFTMLGLASVIHVRILYFLPLFWCFMAFKIQSLSWRTFFASCFGVVVPYWFIAPYLAWDGDLTPLVEHFEQLGWVAFPCDYGSLPLEQLTYYGLLVGLGLTGTVHYMRKRYQDKIRTRMLSDCFITVFWLSSVLLALQPQHFTLLAPMMAVSVSPLIAHFLALTHTRWTNVAFFVITAATLLITAINLWMLSLPS